MSWISDGVDAIGDAYVSDAEGMADAVGDHATAAAMRTAQTNTKRELNLGETKQSGQIVHGSVSAIAAVSNRLRSFAGHAEQTYQGLSAIDTSGWTGQAADQFRASFRPSAKSWTTAADAFNAAAATYDRYADAVRWAQQQAELAIDLWDKAQQATAQAVNAWNGSANTYNASVKTFNAARSAGATPAPLAPHPGPRPDQPGGTDPGAALRAQAQDLVKRARAARDTAGEEAAQALGGEAASAPPSNTADNIDDAVSGTLIGVDHFLAGAVGNVSGSVKSLRSSFDWLSPQNLSHPGQMLQTNISSAKAMWGQLSHPTKLLQGMVDQWKDDPYAAAGSFAVDIASGGGEGAAGKILGTAAKDAAEAATKGVAESAVKGVAKDGAEATGRDVAKDAADTAAKDAARSAEHASAHQIDHGLGDAERELAQVKAHDPGNTSPLQESASVPGHSVERPPEVHESGGDAGRTETSSEAPRPPEPPPHSGDGGGGEPRPPESSEPIAQNMSRLEKALAGVEEHVHEPPEPAGKLKDPYVYDNGVLRNKLGITDKKVLDDIERDVGASRGEKIRDNLPDVTKMKTADALKQFHKEMFGDVYDWAGQYRDITIAKAHKFGKEEYLAPGDIDDGLGAVDQAVKRGMFDGVSDNHVFSEKLSKIWNVLHSSHPFREGNSRTIRLYLDSLATHYGRHIDWNTMGRVRYLEARGEAIRGNYEPMVEMLDRAITTTHP